MVKGKDNDVDPTPDPQDPSETMDAASKSIHVTYDGKAHTVSAKATKEGSKIEYSTDGGKTWSETAPSRTNAGTTNFSIRATNPNYEDVVKEGYKLIVDPKQIVVGGNRTVRYDGTQKTLRLPASAATGVIDGEKLTLTGAAVKGTKVGTYKKVSKYTWSVAKADGSDSTGNYTIKVEGTLTILSAPIPAPDPDPVPTDNDNDPTPPSRGGETPTPDAEVGPPAEAPAAPAPQADAPAPEPTPAPDAEIVDDAVPQAQPDEPELGVWALLNLILTILTVILSLIMLILYIGKRKEEGDENDEQTKAAAQTGDDENAADQIIKKKGLMRLIGIIPAVAAVITFILTEDMSLPMVFTDKWTLLMAVILIVDIIVAILAHKTKKDADDDDNMEGQPSQA